jgi:hypothetical protein
VLAKRQDLKHYTFDASLQILEGQEVRRREGNADVGGDAEMEERIRS